MDNSETLIIPPARAEQPPAALAAPPAPAALEVGPATARAGLARLADRHACYERAVQEPSADAAFVARSFRRLRGRHARVLREDFCGTAALCATWVRRHVGNRAYGIDLSAPALDWGRAKHIRPLGPRAADVQLIRGDVRDPVGFTADVAAAFNFSYFTFKDRPTLRAYFAAVHSGLAPDGVFYLDIFGGPESMDLREERTEFEEFVYVWDQKAFNPITHEMRCDIHFEFPDGSSMRRAFMYNWRLWQIPEVEELAREAGFRDFIVYWEGTDEETGEGNGVFRPSRRGDDASAFIAYLLCVK